MLSVFLQLYAAIVFSLLVGAFFFARFWGERQQARDSLRKSESRLRQIIDLVPHFIFVKDETGKFEIVNKAIAEVFGTTVEDLTGRRDVEFVATEAEMEHFRDDDLEVIESGKTKFIPEEEITDSEGNIRFLQTTKVPFTFSDTEKPSLMGIAVDITESKRVAREREQLEEQLQQAQKMESIGTLAGGVAHDFNNILTVIRGHAQLGLMQTTEENPLWNDLVEIEAASERARNLTRQLLAFSRKQTIRPEIIQVNYLLKELLKMLMRLTGEEINLEFELDEKISPILADPGQIEQIIINLVVNAVDAIKDQPLALGRNITVSTSELLLDNDFVKSHPGSKPGWYLILETTDNGCGISKDIMAHIFDPFYTTKEVGKGTGLGLSTVYGIVKQNNANIYVESESGQGTTFKIYWPSIKDETVKAVKAKELVSAPGGDEVILLVEDEKPSRNLAKKILRQAGYTVYAAENGWDALEKAKSLQGSIDLVFTDVVMPLMGGKELSEHLRASYPHIKVLFTSGYLSDRVARDDDIFKEDRFIDKPYDVPAFLKKIRQLLDSSIITL